MSRDTLRPSAGRESRGGAAPSSPRRIAGALVLAGIAAGLVVAAHRSWKEGVRRSRFLPPFRATGARAFESGGAVWRLEDGRRGPAVVIYVLRGCPHCAAELRRWDALLSEARPVPHPEVWVVAPRRLHGDPWLPKSLRERALRDSAGSTARALGVEVVPTTAYVSPGGTVVARTAGQTPARRMRRTILEFLESSDEIRP